MGLFTTEKFAPPAACDWLITQGKGRMSRATIYDKATGGTTEDYRRTNSQCDLDIETIGVLTFVLRGRIGAITQRQDVAMEVPKILHYAPGETFAVHFDYLDPKEPAYAHELSVRGQRTDTFLIYLNDDFSGGETSFPEIKLSHLGAKGDALLFRNVDDTGAPDHDTMHACHRLQAKNGSSRSGYVNSRESERSPLWLISGPFGQYWLNVRFSPKRTFI